MAVPRPSRDRKQARLDRDQPSRIDSLLALRSPLSSVSLPTRQGETMDSLVNQTYDEIQIGTTFSFPHRLTKMEVDALAFVSGETDGFQIETGEGALKDQVAQAVAGEALLSALLKRRLP